jgi:hypothetical protein
MPCAHPRGPAGHLEQLRAELADRGWITRALDQGQPSLFVQNPDPGAAALNDHVVVAPSIDGDCWFWWPWASPIGAADDIAHAAARITHVLRATDPHPVRPRTVLS